MALKMINRDNRIRFDVNSCDLGRLYRLLPYPYFDRIFFFRIIRDNHIHPRYIFCKAVIMCKFYVIL